MYEEKDYYEATACLQSAVRIDQNCAEAHYFLGKIHEVNRKKY